LLLLFSLPLLILLMEYEISCASIRWQIHLL
jgi:hypothetical protein